MNITEGALYSANLNNVLTSFSPSPIHLEVKLLADRLKNTALLYEAIALPIKVLPVPGGPNRRSPLGGALRPVNISGRSIGHTIAS
jgi:hypothetical protein